MHRLARLFLVTLLLIALSANTVVYASGEAADILLEPSSYSNEEQKIINWFEYVIVAIDLDNWTPLPTFWKLNLKFEMTRFWFNQKFVTRFWKRKFKPDWKLTYDFWKFWNWHDTDADTQMVRETGKGQCHDIGQYIIEEFEEFFKDSQYSLITIGGKWGIDNHQAVVIVPNHDAQTGALLSPDKYLVPSRMGYQLPVVSELKIRKYSSEVINRWENAIVLDGWSKKVRKFEDWVEDYPLVVLGSGAEREVAKIVATSTRVDVSSVDIPIFSLCLAYGTCAGIYMHKDLQGNPYMLRNHYDRMHRWFGENGSKFSKEYKDLIKHHKDPAQNPF